MAKKTIKDPKGNSSQNQYKYQIGQGVEKVSDKDLKSSNSASYLGNETPDQDLPPGSKR